MARNNVGRPRFYIDTFSYLKAIGLVQSEDDTFKVGLNPTEQKQVDFDFTGTAKEEFDYTLTQSINQEIIKNPTHSNGVVGLLGHNFSSAKVEARLKIRLDGGNQAYGDGLEIVNYAGDDTVATYDGFTLYRTDYDVVGDLIDTFTLRLRNAQENVTGTAKLGSIFIGTYYDMPHSPDLNLKLSYEYDGVKIIQTKGGATLSNATYTKPADWGELGCWQLGDGANLRSGRRVWDLSFSYLSDTDVMPNLGIQNYEIGQDNEIVDTEDILTGTDFYTQVINRTMGVGNLPFIFQPDGGADVEGQGNFNPDQFAIARFDMNSFSYEQVANNVYNIKLKIREVW